MYLSAGSYVLIATGIIIHNFDEYPDYINIQFAGSFLISFFAVCYIVALYVGNKKQTFISQY